MWFYNPSSADCSIKMGGGGVCVPSTICLMCGKGALFICGVCLCYGGDIINYNRCIDIYWTKRYEIYLPFIDDQFEIEEVAIHSGEWKDSTYTVSAATMDAVSS